MNTKLLIPLLFFGTFILKAQNISKEEKKPRLHFSIQERFTSWDSSRTWGELDFEIEQFTKLDFSAKFFNKLRFSGILGISNKESKIANYAIALGFKNIGISIEKGNINGRITPSNQNDLNYTQDELEFSSEFLELSLYRMFLGGAIKLGVQYAKFETPIDISVEYENNAPNINYIDPKGSFKLYGLYFGVDMLKAAIDQGYFLLSMSHKNHGFILKSETTLGVAQITPSEFGKERVAQIIQNKTGESVSLSTNTRTMFGFKTTTGIGYGYVNDNNKIDFALSGGFEYNTIGGISFDSLFDDLNTIQSSTEDFSYYGPYVRLLMAW